MPQQAPRQERSETRKLDVPAISLPKGGGAISGTGEKFGVNPVSGAGAASIPIPTSPGRSGFGPQLALSYDTGAGNGPFGFGWSLTIPSIRRKTDKGLPEYRDADESDVYVLSGAEDLVPALTDANERVERHEAAFAVHAYRPRIEGLFARIERWTERATGAVHWRSISRDNVTTLYGRDQRSQIVDPEAPHRIFSWLICESYDDKGNAIVYEYAGETADNVDQLLPNERNRSRGAVRYLKRVRYGNRVSRFVQADLSNAEWLFELVFDYDEGHHEKVAPDPSLREAEQHVFVLAAASPGQSWAVRPDPFSSYRAGFELRSYRRCVRALMFHHIPDLSSEERGYDGLVRSVEFEYADVDLTQPVSIGEELAHEGSTRFASFIRSVTHSGYVKQDTPPITGGGVDYATYLKQSLPPVRFEYSKAKIQEEVRELKVESLENLPEGLDGSLYQLADLDGEGLSGVLTEQAGAWFYKENLGEGRLGPLRQIAPKPSLTNLQGGRQHLLDLAGDGQLDLVEFSGPAAGFYERAETEGWTPFRSFRSLPNLPWNDPSVRFIDLNGDGHADILVAEDEVFACYPSLAEDGFAPARRVHQLADEESGPRLVFEDGAQTLYLADMCGDGLTDLVRIRNGEVCYWPNLGHGHFGRKVAMDNAPLFDRPDQFDHGRIRLADIDGSGASDIIYLAHDAVRLYFNQSGNRLSDARVLNQFPRIDNIASVTTADLLGNGTACLVWSSPLPASQQQRLLYVDLMGGTKPHLLVRTFNNLGTETEVEYASSTRFCLSDKAAGKPWITRLPFPVHVVERVTTRDHISGARFVSRYAYHHGYFDGVEREFRGFGMVEQWDTEEYAALTADGAMPQATNIDAASHVPPIHTKTWFHTGIYLGGNRVSDFFAGMLNANDVGEYYREPGASDAEARALLLDDTVLPAGLSVEEEREACRALKGAMLRQEIYGLDGSAAAPHPYSVAEQNFTIRTLQPRGPNQHAVFFTHAREEISRHYERQPRDPRVSHALTLETDDFGNVLKSAAIGYGRLVADPALAPDDQEKQAQLHATYSEAAFTGEIDNPSEYRAPQPCETRAYELSAFDVPPGGRVTFEDALDACVNAAVIGFEVAPTSGLIQKRLLAQSRVYYRKADFSSALPLGKQAAHGLVHESFALAFSPEVLARTYDGKVSDAMLVQGGYVHTENEPTWWVPSGRVFCSPDSGDAGADELAHAKAHFFLPRRFHDAFHTPARSTEMFVDYDAFDLLIQETRDALDNKVTVGERGAVPRKDGQDYRVLKPALVMDPNGNRTSVAYDALGMVAGSAVMGKPAAAQGDALTASFKANLTQSEIDQFFGAPKANAGALLDQATTRIVYDPSAYARDPGTKRPIAAASITRETHVSDLSPGQASKVQVALTYSDGFGREIQKKIEAEPGPVPERDVNGNVVLGADRRPQMTASDAASRWVGTGWTVFNNKGAPVRQYEPFFTDTHLFEFDVRIGVSPVMFYDPAGRTVATLLPNHTWQKVVFDPWRQESWDVNDTAAIADPAADDDVGTYFKRLADADYLPTWRALRTDAAHAVAFATQYSSQSARTAETAAALKTDVHAATPSVAHADALGRPFLTVAHNRFERAGALVEEKYEARVVLDIEGAEQEVIDANGRVVMRYEYDILGTRIHQASMEAGKTWVLNDVAGQPIHAWDSRGHHSLTEYDQLRRPSRTLLEANGAAPVVIGQITYGEDAPNPEASNLRGKAFRTFDQAGVATTERYDFKGNPLVAAYQLVKDYKSLINWSAGPAVESETFTTRTAYDALNRPTQVTTPDQSVFSPAYNEANFLEKVDVAIKGAATKPFVIDIDYDAKGQRTSIDYQGGARTVYERDPDTLRLTRLLTTQGGRTLQDLSYAYDAAGNITQTADAAHQNVYFNNQVVTPSATYSYDALYRLIRSEGREHRGQAGTLETTWRGEGRAPVADPRDETAMRTYAEEYHYDPAGNFIKLVHAAQGGDWTRHYTYEETSLLESTKRNNRLSTTQIGAGPLERYAHDQHGNMLTMPHLSEIVWDFANRLREADLGGGGRLYCVYGANGQRVRKIVERPGGAIEERIYLGGVELYRERAVGGAVSLERETLHVMDDTQRIALVETRTIGDDGSPEQLIRFQFSNHLGSSSLELDEAGRTISYEEYYPYGATSYQMRATQTPKRYRYTGMERDEETGLAYHGARYYAPWIGRWVSCDPALGRYTNAYNYGANNPIIFRDLDGREPATPDDTPFDPATHPLYIDKKFDEVSYHSWKGTATFKWKDTSDKKVRVSYKEFGQDEGQTFVPLVGQIYANKEAAQKAAADWDKHFGKDTTVYAYYWHKETGVILPTSFNRVSTPEFHKLWPALAKHYAERKQEIREALHPVANAINPIPGTEVDAQGNLQVSSDPMAWLALLKLKRLKQIKKSGPINVKNHSGHDVKYTVTGPHSKLKGTSVYVLKDADGGVLYIGKGDTIDRLRKHITDPNKTQWFGEISKVEVKGTGLTNTQALALEESLIGQLKPQHNVDRTPFKTVFGNTMAVGPNLPPTQKTLHFHVKIGH